MQNLYKSLSFAVFIILLFVTSFAGTGSDKQKSRILVNDHYRYIAVNQIKMWFSNNGDGSHDPQTGGNGFYWPGGINAVKSAVFEDGLLFGGIVGDSIHVNGNTHRKGLQAGKIINGVPDDPSLEKYKIYKILKGWEGLPPGPERDQYESDYNNWPVEDGAPWIDIDGDGVFTAGIDQPEYIGDETAWYVANDMDPDRSHGTYGMPPMGIEFQTTIFAFKNSLYQDMVFKKYLMINKGINTIDSMYVAYWTDADLGDASDDFVGCDTLLNLGYTYNATNNDGVYGSPPPAVGYDYLQRPIVPGSSADSARFNDEWRHGYRNLPITAFTLYFGAGSGFDYYRDPRQGDPQGSVEFYNNMKGLVWDGTQFINYVTGEPTKFVLSGDPVTGTGWYDGGGWIVPPADRRHLISSGPFTFAPGDSQEVIIGILMAQGTSNINSIQVLKEKDIDMKRLYNYYFDPVLVDVKDDVINVQGFTLHQNYPNPFNPGTVINYTLPERSFVSLKVYDILGREVKSLISRIEEAGSYRINFDGSDLPSGVYIYSLETGGVKLSRKMLLMK
jgi:hypothetical protein